MGHILDWTKPYHRFFEEMTRIPHGSYDEQSYSDYLTAFAAERNLKYKQYEIGNVIIYKEGSPGYEDHPAVVLQSHMDMVCEKVPESKHDFRKDPLDLYIEDGWLHARGTTLGADDGTGVAYMLSVLDDDTLCHPPLECVFTVQEEVGLGGAFALKQEDLKGRRYISLDDGGGGMFTTITSAGGMVWNGNLKTSITDEYHGKKNGFCMKIGGLQGGHSGESINQEKGNAIKICARILKELQKSDILTLSDLEGGSKDNAIPRDCRVKFVSAMEYDQIDRIVQETVLLIRREYQYSDAGVWASVTQVQTENVWTQEVSDRLLDFLSVCPDGMRHHSMKIPSLTTASANLAAVRSEAGEVTISISLRAAEESLLDKLELELEILAKLFHISCKTGSRYPAWGYEENSYMREVMKKAVKASMGKDLELLAVHGGLECGVFKSKWPDMDMVTLGPVGKDVHSPDERLDLQSFDDCYELLKEFLQML